MLVGRKCAARGEVRRLIVIRYVYRYNIIYIEHFLSIHKTLTSRVKDQTKLNAHAREHSGAQGRQLARELVGAVQGPRVGGGKLLQRAIRQIL